MSTGAILTVLSNIPWGQVVENAPKVAEGAAKLWNSVTNFRKSASPNQISSVPTFFRGERAVEAQIPNICRGHVV